MKNGNPVAKRSNRKQIVGNIKNGDAKFAVQTRKQLQDFRLGDDIKCACWLVCDQQGWPVQNRHGNEHPLRLTNTYLRRIAAKKFFVWRQADARQCFENCPPARVSWPRSVSSPSFLELRTDPKCRI